MLPLGAMCLRGGINMGKEPYNLNQTSSFNRVPWVAYLCQACKKGGPARPTNSPELQQSC